MRTITLSFATKKKGGKNAINFFKQNADIILALLAVSILSVIGILLNFDLAIPRWYTP